MPTLAFVTVCGENGGVPAKTVESVLAQTSADFIYYLCPAAPGKETATNMRAYAGGDARIVVLEAPAKGGAAAAWNAAANAAFEAGARFLALVEPGDTLAPAFAETTVALAEDSGADVVLTRFAAVDDAGEALGEPLVGFGENIVLTAAEFAAHYCACSMFPAAYECWGKLFAVRVGHTGALQMDEGRGPGLVARFYNACDKICLCDDVLLHIAVSGEAALISGSGLDMGRDEAKVIAAASAARHTFLAKHLAAAGGADSGGNAGGPGQGGSAARECMVAKAASEAFANNLNSTVVETTDDDNIDVKDLYAENTRVEITTDENTIVQNALMADYHDLDEASAYLFRLLDLPLTPADAARPMAAIFSLGFLPAAWNRLNTAFCETGTLFGLPAEKAADIMRGMDCVFREALCFLFINGAAPLKAPVEHWMRTLCPGMMQYFNLEELPSLAQNAGLFQNMACENWRVALLQFNHTRPEDFKNAVCKAFLCRTLGVGDAFIAQFLKLHGKKISTKKRAYLDGASMPASL